LEISWFKEYIVDDLTDFDAMHDPPSSHDIQITKFSLGVSAERDEAE